MKVKARRRPSAADRARLEALLLPTVGQKDFDVWEHYRPEVPAKLTPSPAGRECLGNGTWPGYECCCDECPYFLECFPEQDKARSENFR